MEKMDIKRWEKLRRDWGDKTTPTEIQSQDFTTGSKTWRGGERDSSRREKGVLLQVIPRSGDRYDCRRTSFKPPRSGDALSC